MRGGGEQSRPANREPVQRVPFWRRRGFSVIAHGETDLTLSVAPADLSEGLPLAPTCFGGMTAGCRAIVVPEPVDGVLLVIGTRPSVRRRHL